MPDKLISLSASLLALVGAASAQAQCDDQWVVQYGQAGLWGGRVYSTAVYDDGSGPALYAGGNFIRAGGLTAAGLARWDGLGWTIIGQTNATGAVTALSVYDGRLIAAGNFIQINNQGHQRISAWDGQMWHVIPGMNDYISALEVFDGELYAGGNFTTVGGQPAQRIARWNGSQWNALGPGTNGLVASLRAVNDQLLVGGSFLTAGGISSPRIAAWNGQWSAFAADPTGLVQDIIEYGGDIVITGNFPVEPRLVRRWKNGQWQPLGNQPLGGMGAALTLYQNQLFLGGDQISLNGSGAAAGLRWDGEQWLPLDPQTPHGVITHSMTIFDDQLIVAGLFQGLSEHPINNIARWTPQGYKPLGGGLNGQIHAFTTFQGAPIAAGGFTTANDNTLRGIARFENGEWHSFGNGPGFRVLAVAADEHTLVAAGQIPGQGNTVARWNGEAWQKLGTFNNTITSVAFYGGDLYAAGAFTSIDNQPFSRIARFDGAQWHSVGEGVSGSVSVLKVYNGSLLAGGITQAGGLAVHGLARWDGELWHAMGEAGSVQALAEYNGTLVAGGTSGVAIFNGTSWSPLSNPHAPMQVRALAVRGNNLYIGGLFGGQFAGPPLGSGVVRWDGTQWQMLGDGVRWNNEPDTGVKALLVSDDTLFVGGNFHLAGGEAAAHFARYGKVLPEILIAPRDLHDPLDAAAFSIRATGSGPLSYQWRRNETPLTDGIAPSGAVISGATSRRLIINNISPAEAGQFDVVLSSPCGQTFSPPATLSFSQTCYPNCDNSTLEPILNVDDFTCFINEFAGALSLPHAAQLTHYANCDNSTAPPVLNVDDFTCFINHFAAGCP